MVDSRRRSVLKAGGALLAAGVMASGKWARAQKAKQGRALLEQFRYGEVVLLQGPMQQQFAQIHKTLLALDEDALLKPFRQKAGVPAPGPDLGGWYNWSDRFDPPADMHGFIPGHVLGQHVSSLSRVFAITGDRAAADKASRFVAALGPALSKKFYEGYALPAYTFDKVAVGLIDAHEYVHDKAALKTLDRAVDTALPYLPEKALTREEMRARPHPNEAFTWDESYTLPENMYLAYTRGAGDRYRKLAAKYLLDDGYFNALAANENVLPGRHGYSHVNAFSSAMQAYLVDGSEKHFTAAKNGFEMVLAQSWATGGWAPNEGFVKPDSGELGKRLFDTHASFEAPCGTYGHYKAARYLMRATGESRYGDSMERLLYNAILGALPMTVDGPAFYYADYNMHGMKFYHDYNCPCCWGTLGQVVSDYGISSYFSDARGIYVNLYVPSKALWRQGRDAITLTQQTSYPLTPDISIGVKTPRPSEFSIRLRIPTWAGAKSRVAVNGQPFAMELVPGRFAEVRREWRDGDRVELSLDMPLRLEAVDAQHPKLVALMQGPLALFATGSRFISFQREELLQARQRSAGSTEWTFRTDAGEHVFKPYFAIGMEPTRLYQSLTV
jgi:uncharacterized protein